MRLILSFIFGVALSVVGFCIFGCGYDNPVDTSLVIAADVESASESTDITPPELISASGSAGSDRVVVIFSERVMGGSGDPGHYEVYRSGNPDNRLLIISRDGGGETVTLWLHHGYELGVGTYTVRVSDVQDEAGNTIVACSTTDFGAG